MPILRVDIVGTVADAIREGLAQRIADAAGRALDSGPQGTWTVVNFVPATQYAENETATEESPVLVSLMMAQPPTGAALSDTLVRLTQALAKACARPAANVHIIVEPPGTGRVAFGGSLVR